MTYFPLIKKILISKWKLKFVFSYRVLSILQLAKVHSLGVDIAGVKMAMLFPTTKKTYYTVIVTSKINLYNEIKRIKNLKFYF